MMSTTFANRLRRINADERGNVAITFGLMMIPICGIMGLAVDYGQAIRTQARMQTAADAAALAAVNARTLAPAERLSMAEATFRTNFSPEDPSSAPEPVITIDGSSVSVDASTGVPTTFSAIYGVEELQVGADSKAEVVSSGKKLEVGLMIDLTGSMGSYRNGEAKIASLKTASGDLLDILLPESGANDGMVKIAVAPFADYVNAGDYASAATGLPTSGTYDNLNNLASQKNGTFTGTYAVGTIGNALGSQSGATSATSGTWSPSAGTTTSGGATYSNDHCAVTTQTTTTGGGQVSFVSNGNNNANWPIGAWIATTNWGYVAPPSTIVWATNGSKVKQIQKYRNNDWQATTAYNSYYWLKVPQTTAGLTWATDGGYKIGIKINLDGNNSTYPEGLVAATATDRIKEIDYWNAITGQWVFKNNGTAQSSGRYVLVPTSWNTAGTTTTTTLPQCTTSPQNNGQLISCVTERTGSEAYSDAAPTSSAFIGPYNHYSNSKSNYSSDGKCYVAGRELPKIIPLTDDRSTIEDFFTNAKVGGATPGHLGTAWAWYMISPLWNSVFGTDAAEYDDAGTSKAVILMTDGEYNIHYSSPAARTQALALCTAMKAKGVKVYTIGFGFSTSSTAADNTTEGRAKDLMQKCASPAADGGSNNYYFPYDGDALRETFSSIGNSLVEGSVEDDVVRVTQ